MLDKGFLNRTQPGFAVSLVTLWKELGPSFATAVGVGVAGKG